MPRTGPPIAQQRFEDTYRESREIVRRATERAAAASARARKMREALQAQRAGGAHVSMAQLAVEEAQHAARETERFIAIISHELRQPVNASLAALSLLEANPGAEVAPRAWRVVQRQLLQMSRLLDDLLDMSRLSMQSLRLDLGPLDLRGVVEAALETIAALAQERGQEVKVTMPGQPVQVQGDASRLQQVFANLLSNAVRYTPRGGHIGVSVHEEAGHAIVRVTDSGQGMNAEDLAHIFEPFRRGGEASSEGFGIGLTLARELIELHGGTVRAASAGAGRGSTFTVRLGALR